MTPKMPPEAVRRRCVVTGASSGIGAAVALWFARNGHDVLINFTRNQAGAELVAARCRATGADAMAFRADVADEHACAALAHEVRSRWGALDTLVNNAGATTGVADIKDLQAVSPADFRRAFDVNVIGAFQMSRALAPLMNGRPNASIVNISSMAATLGTGSSMAYAASKGALNALTLALARSLAPAIRVNAVLPGLTETAWLDGHLSPDQVRHRKDRYTARALLRQTLEPEDVASAAGWLAVAAHKATGQLLELDAGFRLG